jgi:lysylphosphatidylglycerol synthetase-like protein (DUF2156 family)
VSCAYIHKKITLILVVTAGLLIALIGLGVWTLLDKKQSQKAVQNEQAQTKIYTTGEVARHSSKSDCWTIISGDVYNLTEFINRHPGEILRACKIGKLGKE